MATIRREDIDIEDIGGNEEAEAAISTILSSIYEMEDEDLRFVKSRLQDIIHEINILLGEAEASAEEEEEEWEEEEEIEEEEEEEEEEGEEMLLEE